MDDAAQEKGAVVGAHDGAKKRAPDGNAITTVEDIGLTRKDIRDAHIARAAEAASAQLGFKMQRAWEVYSTCLLPTFRPREPSAPAFERPHLFGRCDSEY